MIVFKAITFVENDDIRNGHYFYGMTLPEAMEKMKQKGIDPIKNVRMNIAVYPW